MLALQVNNWHDERIEQQQIRSYAPARCGGVWQE
jgi:hypothetical protein